MRGTCYKIGGGRSYQQPCGLSSEMYVIQRIARPKDLTIYPAACDRLERDRADKLLRGTGHHNIHIGAILREQARQPN
jgi:hypothetical protein